MVPLVLELVLSMLAFRLVVFANVLGHTAVGLFRSDGLAAARVGRSPSVWRIRRGRLLLCLHPLPARSEADGKVTIYTQLDRASQIAYVLAGPVAGPTSRPGSVSDGSRRRGRSSHQLGILWLVLA
jgi:hypothetical protein